MSTGRRYRVLVVDDEEEVLVTTSLILSSHFDVTTCRSGQEALKILDHSSFEVVCADFRMPDMDGMDLLRRITALPACISGLLITGQVDALMQKEWNASRLTGLILKPYEPERLISTVEQFARLAEMRRTVNEASTP